MGRRSRLHIPQAPARPGDRPDFSYLETSPAGAVARPNIDATCQEIEPISAALIRVLGDDDSAVGPWNPQLGPEDLRTGLRHMLMTRIFDERMLRMQRQGKISFYLKSTGEEAVSVAQAMALRPSDMLFPSYRNQGLFFARGCNPVELMCQCLSNTGDMCKGRQLPVLYHWKEGNIFTIAGNLAIQAPNAVGWAMAAAIKDEDNIAATWLGDGSTAEADFHNALLFASVYQAPVVINVTNNQWAISTFQAFAGGDRGPFSTRGLGLGVPGLRVDGNDFLAVHGVTQWAAERARTGAGPTLVELVTYRASAHSTSDDPSRYRPDSEWDDWPLGDPIERLKKHLLALGEWSERQHHALQSELEENFKTAWQEALGFGTLTQGPQLSPDSMFDDVFKEMPPHLAKQRQLLRKTES